ncbi:MAG: hypothetical protein JW920_08750 [Deltaproteobacteria bacterium]|nr:hypothetical protein [Deltaproteobacteria bacterium]
MIKGGMYEQAHLFVAGLRVLEHLNGRPPALKDFSELLGISQEELSRISRFLEDHNIIGVATSGAEQRFFVLDHGKIEELPRQTDKKGIEDEITKFKHQQTSRLKEIEESLGKKKDKDSIFSELDKALKDPGSMLKKKKNPLD